MQRIELISLTKRFGETQALRHVDLSAAAGEVAAICGENGAGKSTLLKAALGVITPLSGQVTVFGRPLASERHRIAYVPQRASVDWDFPTRVIDVVLMGLGASSVDWSVRIWVNASEFWPKKQELTRAIKIELDNAGIGIPFPQRVVTLVKEG